MCSLLHQCLLFHSHILFTYFSPFLFSESLYPLHRTQAHTHVAYTFLAWLLLHPFSEQLSPSLSAVVALSFWVLFRFFHINIQLMWMQKINWSHTYESHCLFRCWASYSFSTTHTRTRTRAPPAQEMTASGIQYSFRNSQAKRRNERRHMKTMAFYTWNIYFALSIVRYMQMGEYASGFAQYRLSWHKESRERHGKNEAN